MNIFDECQDLKVNEDEMVAGEASAYILGVILVVFFIIYAE